MRFLLISANLFLLLALTVPINAQEPSFVPEKGEEVYREHCARCHGVEGKGNGPDAAQLIVPPTNFHRPESRAKSDLDLRGAIIWGLAFSPMHGWWDKMDVEDIRAVTAYIRRMAPYDPGIR